MRDALRVLAVLWLAAGPHDAAAQRVSASESNRIEQEVARYLRIQLGDKTIGFDGSTSPYIGLGASGPVRRDKGQIAELRKLLHAVSLDVDRAVVCSKPDRPSSCRIVGADVLLRISPPVVKGDSAWVWTYRRSMGVDVRTPVDILDVEVILVRTRDGWVVKGEGMARVS